MAVLLCAHSSLAVALYYSFDPNEGWAILGTVTTKAPRCALRLAVMRSGIFRTGWATMGAERYASVNIGISLERYCWIVSNDGQWRFRIESSGDHPVSVPS